MNRNNYVSYIIIEIHALQKGRINFQYRGVTNKLHNKSNLTVYQQIKKLNMHIIQFKYMKLNIAILCQAHMDPCPCLKHVK